tara:strand:+ start:894 stop:1184 length:291 start_codon:yes stop_codon:yes gene_type:complete
MPPVQPSKHLQKNNAAFKKCDGRDRQIRKGASVTRLLRMRDVTAMTTLSRTTIHLMVKTGRFPKPTVLGTKTHVWNSDQVEKWIRQLPQQDLASEA